MRLTPLLEMSVVWEPWWRGKEKLLPPLYRLALPLFFLSSTWPHFCFFPTWQANIQNVLSSSPSSFSPSSPVSSSFSPSSFSPPFSSFLPYNFHSYREVQHFPWPSQIVVAEIHYLRLHALLTLHQKILLKYIFKSIHKITLYLISIFLSK